jgi:hypothetical protein
VFGDNMQQYTQMQAADSIRVAAENPGGIAGAGAGIGAGMAIGNAMGQAFGNQQQQYGGSAPPPPPSGNAPPPPPGAVPNAPRWSLAIDGKTYGPYTDDALKGMVSSGQVAASTQAWRPGAAGWAPVSSYDEITGGSAAAPPPPPPK